MSADCDHKFIDSKHCVKCGWVPHRGQLDLVPPTHKDKVRETMRKTVGKAAADGMAKLYGGDK